jgi:uncharacterized protein YecE (DUF72 family)
MNLFEEEKDLPQPTKTGVRVGTAGYSYADWKGPFYPADLPNGDMLPFYAQHFPVVEVNYSYYRIPAARTSAAMLHKAPHLEYAVKLFGGFTHEPDPDWAALSSFVYGIQPFIDAGKLATVLAQFPWAFKAVDESWDRLKRIAEGLAGIPINVEFRNIGWHQDTVRERLTQMGLGLVNVDEPHLKGLLPATAFATNKIGYVRMHGRNYKKWWHSEKPDDRYNYSYSIPELEEWIPRLKELNKYAERSYVIFNNHPLGQAVVAAREMMSLLLDEGM